MWKLEFLPDGIGLAITWHKCAEHDFAIIFLCFAIKYKHCS